MCFCSFCFVFVLFLFCFVFYFYSAEFCVRLIITTGLLLRLFIFIFHLFFIRYLLTMKQPNKYVISSWNYEVSMNVHSEIGPIGWDCWIHWLYLSRSVRFPQRVSWCDTKQSDSQASIMRCFPSLTSFQGPLWSGMVAFDEVLSIGWIELNREHMLNWIVWNRTDFHI